MIKRYLLFILFFLVIFFISGEEEKKNDDKTLSPYFLVKTQDENFTVDQFPLRSTNVEVKISGVIADVTVKQIYKNQGKIPIEAIYIFPLSTRASVYGLEMKINDREISAVIEKKEKAKEKYEKAKKEGKTASLLEQERPNVFKMNVANILPGDEIEVELHYTEIILSTDGIYEFVYPTVVGPRYSNKKKSVSVEGDKWIQNPYLHEKIKPDNNLFLNININSGIPISDLICLTHNIDTIFNNEKSVSIKLTDTEKNSGNKDFILKYSLSGKKIQTGMLIYEDNKENYFLLMMEPPERNITNNIVPREYIFIIDVSGSMSGFPLDVSKSLIINLISELNEKDIFNVILFSGTSAIFSRSSVKADKNNLKKAINFIEKTSAGGGTELLPALKEALNLPLNEKYSRNIIITTDGYIDIEEQVFNLLQNNLGKSNFFAFGIGSSVNRYLIEGMAHIGRGEPFIAIDKKHALIVAEKLREYINSPILTNIKINFNNFNCYDIQPPDYPDLYANRPLLIYGKWKGELKGNIAITGFSADKSYNSIINMNDILIAKDNKSLKYLWARKKIELLSDYNMINETDERINEITNLSLSYNILSKYTSFVAIDKEIRNKNDTLKTVKQPLPLPENVKDSAVGLTPEPHEWLIIIMVIVIFVYLYRKKIVYIIKPVVKL